MTKTERQRLVRLARNFQKNALEADRWMEKNSERCGHSNTDDALGDEGWHKLHRLGGVRDSYSAASAALYDLIDDFDFENLERAAKQKAKKGKRK